MNYQTTPYISPCKTEENIKYKKKTLGKQQGCKIKFITPVLRNYFFFQLPDLFNMIQNKNERSILYDCDRFIFCDNKWLIIHLLL